MPRKKLGPRVRGPYRHRRRWQLQLVGFGDQGGQTATPTYATRAKALRMKRLLLKQIGVDGRSVGESLDAYEDYLIRKGNKSDSVATTLFRLRAFFDADEELTDLTADRCQELYDELTALVAVDTHRNTLGQAKTFGQWLVRKKKWLPDNPLAEIEGEGERSVGKEQLGIDEARKWETAARALADQGDLSAIANLTAFYLGLRPGEVVARVARDLDDGGSILWIRRGKTKKSRRYLEVPEPLRVYLLETAANKAPSDRLFPFRRAWVNDHTARICRLAKVPRVVAHSLRGLHSTLAREAGATGNLVAQALGHASFDVTKRHYLAAGADDRANQQRMLRVIKGGKKTD